MNPNGCCRPPRGLFERPDPYPKPPFTGPRPTCY